MAALILKATERCNSNCIYCDVVHKEHRGADMSLETLEAVFARIGEHLGRHPDEHMTVIWHGGEPLLLGTAYFEAAASLQQRYCGEYSSRISHAIQTNLTRFGEEFLDVFRHLGIGSVGTSFEPLPHVRGARNGRDSDRYTREFLRGVQLLEKHGIGWGMIYVVTKMSLECPLDIFRFLTNMQPRSGVNLNAVLIYDDERRHIAITPREYADFLGIVFEEWWRHEKRFSGVQPFRSLAESVRTGNPSLGCVDSGACAYTHVNIAPDGGTSQCGRAADWGLLQYGSIADRSLDDILSDSQRAQLEERTERIHETDCKGCRFWWLCHGGCPLDAHSGYGDFMHKSEWCEARRHFLEHYFEPITGMRASQDARIGHS